MTDPLDDEVMEAVRAYRRRVSVPRDEMWRRIQDARGSGARRTGLANRWSGGWRIAAVLTLIAFGVGTAFGLGVAIRRGGWFHRQRRALPEAAPIAPRRDSVVGMTVPEAPRETVRGDTIVSLATPLHPGGGALVEDLSIGGAGAPPDHFFRTVNDILAARDGTVWILDHGGNPTVVPAYPTQVTGAPLLRHYDGNGKLLGVAGKVGKEVGEFQFPSNLAQLPDGRIAVWELSVRRMTIFSERGSALTSWTVDGPPRGTPVTFVAGADGVFYVGWNPEWIPGPDLRDSLRGPRFIRFSPTGAVIDTMPSPAPIPNLAGQATLVFQPISAPVSARTVPLPYAPRSIVVWNPLGFWITGLSAHYAFELRRTPRTASVPRPWHDGDTVISVRRDVPPVRVDGSEREEQATRLATMIRLTLRSYALTGAIPPVPEVKPAWIDIVSAPDGRILVQPSLPSAPYDPSPAEVQKTLTAVHWQERTAYDVFKADGTLVGRIVLPNGVRMMTMRGDFLWGMITAADGAQTVRRFRIVWSDH